MLLFSTYKEASEYKDDHNYYDLNNLCWTVPYGFLFARMTDKEYYEYSGDPYAKKCYLELIKYLKNSDKSGVI